MILPSVDGRGSIGYHVIVKKGTADERSVPGDYRIKNDHLTSQGWCGHFVVDISQKNMMTSKGKEVSACSDRPAPLFLFGMKSVLGNWIIVRKIV